MFYTIYKITNKLNNKIYIGKHQTKNLNDKYMGSGKRLWNSIKKYGIENFEKEILFVFDNEEEMNKKEAELVTEEFCLNENTYNICVGGQGGWSYIRSLDSYKEQVKIAGIAGYKKCKELEIGIYSKTFVNPFKNKEIQQLGNTKESREKAIKSQKLTYEKFGHQKGEKNSQYNTIWIFSLELKKSKKISKEDIIPEGWKIGRKIKF